MNDYLHSIRLSNYLTELPKSMLPASHAEDNGPYPFYCSSSIPKSSPTWLQDKSAILMGTGGIASVHLGQGYYAYSTDTWAIRINGDKLNIEYAYRLLQLHLDKIDYLGFEGSGLRHLRKGFIKNLVFGVPSYERQQKIATILTSIDMAIEKTEALIQKYQQIKAGLMHDLFTRGVTTDGKLRPPREQASELYQETPIGWVPRDWQFGVIGDVVESLVDGPFGSNLKTEHYVLEAGVRVVRLQNIQTTKYNDNDKAFVSNDHADFLVRNKVVSGDILIAGLGEDRYPVGRACLYPENMPPAVNKADCFRLRCNPAEMLNAYMMFYLNTVSARKQIKKYEQGVTRPRINTGNFKKLLFLKPGIEEQRIVVERLMKVISRIEHEDKNKEKLLLQKQGLMQDLLTGKVRVKVDQTETANV